MALKVAEARPGARLSGLQPLVSFVLGAAAAAAIIVLLQAASFRERSVMDALARSNGTDQVAKRDGEMVEAAAALDANITKANTTTEEATPFGDLASLLERIAADDKTVIMTSVNHAWAAPNSLLDLFLESFHVGEDIEHLLRHLLVVAVDPEAFERCKEVHPHCYFHKVEGVGFTSEKVFMSKEYVELVWSKLKLQRRILELGYSFLFTDVDILWFRNPFKHITVYADMTTSSDLFFGDPDEINNFPNTGLIYVKSNKRTIEMVKYWHESKDRFPGGHEQHIFNQIKRDLVDRLHVKLQYIDTKYMGGFCNHGKDLNKICTMHANCCVGLGSKLRDLRSVLSDWKNYTKLPDWVKNTGTASWTVPGACIR